MIRLEEQVRFERLFPDDLRTRIPEFTRDQFVALRFASDIGLPSLAREVLDQRIHDRSAIKQMIKEWRADHFEGVTSGEVPRSARDEDGDGSLAALRTREFAAS